MPIPVLHSPHEAADWLRARVRGQLQADSRQVRSGDGFIAWPGAATDGRQFVRAALAQGAAACLVEHEGAEDFGFDDEAIAAYPQLKAGTALVADAYHDHPSQALSVVAVTGTNGKTSTAWWISSLLSKLKLPALSPCAVVGTLGIGVAPHVAFTGMTTPDPVLLQRRFRDFVDEGVRSCAIEASSIGIAEHRLDGTRLRVAVFTNFTQDHLDYHGSMQAYWKAKAALFDWTGLEAAVINLDDPRGSELANAAARRGLDVWTVALAQPARLTASGLTYGAQGMQWVVHEGGQAVSLSSNLVGDYNASNLMGVLGALRALGVPLVDAVAACQDLLPVPGRMERVDGAAAAPAVVVDYAHTPDALAKALAALRPLAAARGGQLWCVFGCGGNRDPGKRPLMAAAAEATADRVIVTSDNPRDEDPLAIIDQVLVGLRQRAAVQVLPDRAQAIATAVRAAAAEDVVLVAGKGHETYQEVRGERRAFSDLEHAQQALAARDAPQERRA